jgi:hypothetical protein
MYNGQIEMSFGNGRGASKMTRRQRRLSRAHWWFQRMRQVVDRATDWRPAPVAPPEQIWLPGARHEQLERVEHQICE